jgi:hypothetical protein
LSSDENLPRSIKHWVMYLGDDLYLSKFGRSGEGTESHVMVMNLEGMKFLYNCKKNYTAKPKLNAEAWDGFNVQELNP